MLASKDEYLQEASETIFRMSADDLVRKRCLDREEYYQDLRSYERKIEQDRIEHEQDIRNYEQKIEQDRLAYEEDKQHYEQKIAQNRIALAERDAQIRQLQAELETLKKQHK